MMENVLSRLNKFFFPEVVKEEKNLLPSVEEELIQLKKKIAAAQSRFNTAATDGEIETAIYDLNTMETRYRLLLRRLRDEAKAES